MSFKETKKKFLRRVALATLPPIASLLIRFIYFTSKKNFHLPSTFPDEPVIFAFWHGDLLMQPLLYSKLKKRPKANVLISDHFDGQIIAKTIKYFGLNTIHGSSTRGGVKVLLNGIKSLKNGYDIGITPDGPKGPRHSVSDGVMVMAKKTHAKVMIFHTVPHDYWQLKSWDKFTIPKPFTTLDFYASEPIDLEGIELEDARKLIYKKLMSHAV